MYVPVHGCLGFLRLELMMFNSKIQDV